MTATPPPASTLRWLLPYLLILGVCVALVIALTHFGVPASVAISGVVALSAASSLAVTRLRKSI
ncbi:hypothetical protein GCM10029963_79790 [Micromonospora andamanensis]|nr:hypothetical protein Vwe01_38620 [Micromonospora andamanensis]